MGLINSALLIRTLTLALIHSIRSKTIRQSLKRLIGGEIKGKEGGGKKKERKLTTT